MSFWEAGRRSGGSCSGAVRSHKPDSCGRTEIAIVELCSSREGALLCSLVGALESAPCSDPVVVPRRAEPYHRSWPLGRLSTLLVLAATRSSHGGSAEAVDKQGFMRSVMEGGPRELLCS